MNGRRPGPQPVRDVEDYEARRYPPGYFTRYKRQQDVRRLHEILGPGPLRVLDIPCGSGRLIGPMADRAYRVVGADLSPEMLAAARERGGGGDGRLGLAGPLGLVRADVRRLPFRERSFDLVVSMRFLYYFGAEERREVIRALAGLSRRWLLLQYRIRESVPAFLWRVRYRAGITRRDRSRRCMTVTEIRREVEEACGFRLVRMRPVSVWMSDRGYFLFARPPDPG